MLELKTGYMTVEAERDEVNRDWINVRIDITNHKPLELLKEDIFNMDWLVYATIIEYLDSEFMADTAMEILTKPDTIIKLNKFPTSKSYSFYIDDIKKPNQIEKELINYLVMSNENSGFITEEAMLLIEAFRYVRENLCWIDSWNYSQC